jgi:3',5'-cyclic AMP phosphodiesterase CpdA
MPAAPRFLHITDTHVTGKGVPLKRDDLKAGAPGIAHATREAALDFSLERLSERLRSASQTLDAVIFTGDATVKGEEGGQRALLDIITTRLAPVGIVPARIVATPGNHDVLQGTAPASIERYRPFLDVWRNAGCVTPWLDGIDPVGATDLEKHRLVSPHLDWAIFPINSANWSQIDTILPAPLLEVWPDLHRLLEKDDPAKAKLVRDQLDALSRADMARVSELQLEEFRRIVGSVPTAATGQVRFAALHHHLSAPSLREEVKAFADFTNLQLLRQALRSSKIDVVLHGHKHEHVARFDEIYDVDGLAGERPHRALVLSGATFTETQDKEAARILVLEGLPFIPVLETQAVPVSRGGVEPKLTGPQRFRLWRSPKLVDEPVVIQGTNLDVVYHQACSAAVEDAPKGTLIVHLELDASTPVRLPVDYPLPPGMSEKERDAWFEELVRWWQLGVSALDHRVPYLHGIRLRRFAGSIDQIQRIRTLLKAKETSRALATLIDPVRDFDSKGQDEDFASFCLVQFRRRGPDDGAQVDVIGYYRAQEFERWWPINVAELRSLQIAVVKGTRMVPGRITTVTAEARSIGRSPTQVAMPAIDRWLDQHPERIHVLANCFLGKGPGGEVEGVVRRQWAQMLDDLEAATLAFNPDGVPVPIDGLTKLSSYISAETPRDDAGKFQKKIEELVKENMRFSNSSQDYGAWEAWGAREILPDLRKLSLSLLG